MFQHHLKESELAALLQLLIFLALRDGKLTDGEVACIRRLAPEVDIMELIGVAAGAELSALCRPLRRDVAARVALLEMLHLAQVDGEYHNVERATVIEVAEELAMNLALVERLEGWVARGLAHEREGEALVTG